MMSKEIKKEEAYKIIKDTCIKARKERFLEIKSWIIEYTKTGDLTLKRKIHLTIKRYAKEDDARKKRIESIKKSRQILFQLKNTENFEKQRELQKELRLCRARYLRYL